MAEMVEESIKRVSLNVVEVQVRGKDRDDVLSYDTGQMVLQKAAEMGIADPAVEPARGRLTCDKATGLFYKTYRIIGAQ